MEKVTREILHSRGKKYGDYSRMANIAQGMKAQARSGASWPAMPPHQRESIEMILLKIARMVEGDPNEQDNFDDILGYATLMKDRMANRAPGTMVKEPHDVPTGYVPRSEGFPPIVPPARPY